MSSFSQALEHLRMGKKLTREGHEKHWFIFLVNGSKFTVNRAPLNTILIEGAEVNYRPHIDIMYDLGTIENKIAVWTPNITEILAMDWVVLTQE